LSPIGGLFARAGYIVTPMETVQSLGGFEEGTNMLSKAGKGSADKASGSGFHGQREFKRQTEMSLNL